MLSRSIFRATRTSIAIRPPHRSSISALIHSSHLPKSTPLQSSWGATLQSPVTRWYSDAAEQKAAETKPTEAKEAEAVDVEALKTELEAKKKEVAVLKDQYLRQVADYQNLQTRTKRDAQAARDFALQSFVKELIASIDNLEHALASVPEEKLSLAEGADAATIHKDLVNLHSGLSMIETVLMGTLNKHGVTRFDPAEEAAPFDPNKHEAVFQAPVAGKEDNTVFHTQQKGFLLNGRVLRAAQVGVVKNS